MKNLKILFNNKKLLTTILLVGIILLASFLRLYQLTNVPPSPDWDEAALGYNAYSILQTGRDEYGKFLPFVLQSFDDYKPALYLYFIVPLIPLFGLDLLAIRLPSAILGILSVLAAYFLVYELFKRKDIALVSSLLLAISPWHIQFSRVAFESSTGLAFNIFGALFFLKGLKNPWLLLLSALFFGLNLSVYQSDRVFTPLLVLTMVIIFWKQLFAVSKKYLLGTVVVGFIAVLPFATYLVTNSNALSRLKGVSILSAPTQIKLDTQQKYVDDKISGNPTGVVFHNRFVSNSREVLQGYLSHFDINWLFIRGDMPRHHAPAMGQMYLWELPFLLIGIYILIFSQFALRTKLFIFAWLLLAPVPAAITNDVPHSVRTLNVLPTLQILVSLGVISTFLWFRNKKYFLRFGIYGLFIFFASFNFFYYLNQYFVQQNYFTSSDWQYGYKEAVAFVQQNEKNYDHVVVSNQVPFDQSYVFFLFYLQYPPQQYQIPDNNHNFGKYEFRPIEWAKDKEKTNTLFVGSAKDFPEDVLSIKTIFNPDGTKAKIIVGR